MDYFAGLAAHAEVNTLSGGCHPLLSAAIWKVGEHAASSGLCVVATEID